MIEEPLDRDSTEIVLRRAFELAEVEPGDDVVLGRQTLAEIADDVDLPLAAVAAALAERQLGIDTEGNLLDRLVGPAVVAVQQPSSADEDEMRARAVAWLEAAHGLRPRVKRDGVVVATRRRDVFGKIGRRMRDAQGSSQLGKLRRIEIVAVDVGETPGVIGVAADVSGRRRRALFGGSAVAVGTTVLFGAGAVALGPIYLIGIPVAAGAGLLTSRSVHEAHVGHVRDDLDDALDRITQAEEPATLLGWAAGRLTRSILKGL